MGKLRVLSGRDVCRILEQYGFQMIRQRGSHVVMQRRTEDHAHRADTMRNLQRQIEHLDRRVDQAYTDKLDGTIPQEIVLRNLNTWQSQRATLQGRLEALKANLPDATTRNIAEVIELANHATSLYKSREAHEKAQLLKTIQSNCRWDGETPHPIYRKPFDVLAHGVQTGNWVPSQDSNCEPRCWLCSMRRWRNLTVWISDPSISPCSS